jgi:hypothetical protein
MAQREGKGRERREFIWKKGVLEFGLPVSLIVSVYLQFKNADPGVSMAARVIGMVVGTVAGALVAGGLFGWGMWRVFGPRSDGRK